MELNELHIAEDRAGPIGHGHAVSGRHIGIGRDGIDVTRAAGRQDHSGSRDDLHATALPLHIADSRASSLFHKKVQSERVINDLDVGMTDELPQKRANDLSTCGIPLRVQDTASGVGRLPTEFPSFPRTIKPTAPGHQFLNISRAFFDEDANGLGIAQSGSRSQRIFIVQLDLIVVAEDDGDASLRVFGARFGETVFGEDENTTDTSQFNGCPQASNAAADDDEISLRAHLSSAVKARP